MTMAPMSPAYPSAASAVWLWYIHMTDDGSRGPGPARSGTFQTYVHCSLAGTESSPLSVPAAVIT